MIEIIRQPNNLEREVWRFQAMTGHRLETIVILNYYYKQSRSSNRHKWVSESYYERLNGRQSRMKVENVPLPVDVEAEAIEQFMTMVKVVKEL